MESNIDSSDSTKILTILTTTCIRYTSQRSQNITLRSYETWDKVKSIKDNVRGILNKLDPNITENFEVPTCLVCSSIPIDNTREIF